MKLTRLHVAGVASIVLFWALFACYAVEDVSEGGTTASVGADLIIWLLLASGSSIIVFAKLGPHPASYNGIAQWTLLSLYGIHVAFYFAVYYEEPKVRTLISAVFLTAGFGLFVLAMIMTPPATHSIPLDPSAVQVQSKTFLQRCEESMWYLFVFVVLSTVMEVMRSFTSFTLQIPIFTLLIVSCWIVASTPSASKDKAETLVQQEEADAIVYQGAV
jgi:hypothetical protein